MTICYFSVPILVSHDTLKTLTYGQEHLGSIVYVWIRSIFCFNDFMIHFTDFMLFLGSYYGYSHDTLKTLTYGQDHFSSIIHVWIQFLFLIHIHTFSHIFASLTLWYASLTLCYFSFPMLACTFQATIGGKFAPLIGLSDEDMDTMITTYNTAVTDAASEILGKERHRKKPWVTKDVLNLCDERRDLKKKRYKAEGAKEYREANRRIQKAVKKAKEDWIGAQCEEIETCLNKNNSKRAYQLVKDLTSEKQGRSSTIQDKSGKYLTEEREILSRWTEYCSDLYNYESCGDNTVLDCSQPPEEDLQPILHEEVEIAVASLKKGKSDELILYQQNFFKLAGRP